MDVVCTRIETIFAKIEVLTFQTVKSLPPDRLLLTGTLVAKILLSQRLVNLGTTRLSYLVTQGHRLRWCHRQHLNWPFSRVIRAWHSHSDVPKITLIIWTIVHLVRSHTLQAFFDEILSELNHGMWARNPPVSGTFLAGDLFSGVVEASEARETVWGRDFTQSFKFWVIGGW